MLKVYYVRYIESFIISKVLLSVYNQKFCYSKLCASLSYLESLYYMVTKYRYTVVYTPLNRTCRQRELVSSYLRNATGGAATIGLHVRRGDYLDARLRDLGAGQWNK